MRDNERFALETVYNALASLDEESRARVLTWIVDYFRYAPLANQVPPASAREGGEPG